MDYTDTTGRRDLATVDELLSAALLGGINLLINLEAGRVTLQLTERHSICHIIPLCEATQSQLEQIVEKERSLSLSLAQTTLAKYKILYEASKDSV